MTSQVVKVRREKIAACITCPICNKFLRDATTIAECLHTFCRKCIIEKLTVEDFDCCPVCNINLGCAPLDKLRADHSLQDLRAKIFLSKKTKAKSFEAVPSTPLPTRRKEGSLSSLVVSTPRIPAQTGAAGKRTKPAGRKVLASQELTFPIEEDIIKPVEDHAGCSSSPETINNNAQNILKSDSLKDDPEGQLAVVRSFLTPYDDHAADSADASDAQRESLLAVYKVMHSTISEGMGAPGSGSGSAAPAKAQQGKGAPDQPMPKGKGIARESIPENDPILKQLKKIDPGYNEPWVLEIKRADGSSILKKELLIDDPEAQMAVVKAFLTPYDDLATEVADPRAIVTQSLTTAAQHLISAISLNKLLMKTEQELRVAERKHSQAEQTIEDLKKELGREQDNSRYHHDRSQRTLQEMKKLQEEHDRVTREKDESYTRVWGERLKLADQVEELTQCLEQTEKDAREAVQHQKDKIQRLFDHFTEQVNVIGCTLYRQAWECRNGPEEQWITPDQMDLKIGYQPGVYPDPQFVDSDEEIGDGNASPPVAIDITVGSAAPEGSEAEMIARPNPQTSPSLRLPPTDP